MTLTIIHLVLFFISISPFPIVFRIPHHRSQGGGGSGVDARVGCGFDGFGLGVGTDAITTIWT
jgi:hypothetical protein